MQRCRRGVGSLLVAAALGSSGACGGGGATMGPPSSAAPASGAPASAAPGSGTPVITDGVAIAQRDPALLTIGYIERLPRMDYVWNSS